VYCFVVATISLMLIIHRDTIDDKLFVGSHPVTIDSNVDMFFLLNDPMLMYASCLPCP
jgi:hypothetical protein